MPPLGRNILEAKNIGSQIMDVKTVSHLKNSLRHPTVVVGKPDCVRQTIFMLGIFSNFLFNSSTVF